MLAFGFSSSHLFCELQNAKPALFPEKLVGDTFVQLCNTVRDERHRCYPTMSVSNDEDGAEGANNTSTATTAAENPFDGETRVNADVPRFLDEITDENGNIFEEWWDVEELNEDLWEEKARFGTGRETRRSPLVDPANVFDDSDIPSPQDDPREYLRKVDKDTLSELKQKFDGEALQRHIRYHANVIAKQETQENAHPGFVITHEQEDTPPKIVDDTDDGDDWSPLGDNEIETDTKGCPECGSGDTSQYQQQVGGADEGMTSFLKCKDCGHSWREGY